MGEGPDVQIYLLTVRRPRAFKKKNIIGKIIYCTFLVISDRLITTQGPSLYLVKDSASFQTVPPISYMSFDYPLVVTSTFTV